MTEHEELESLKEKISEIKSYREPPWDEKDMYYQREPWNKFGIVSAGICVQWCWFNDEYIYSHATKRDIEMAYDEIKNGTKV